MSIAVFTSTALVSPAWAADNYDIRLTGAPDDLKDQLRSVSDLAKERRPYPTRAAVRLRGQKDAKALTEALIAAGYYNAQVTFSVDGPAPETTRLQANFDIKPGPRFTITKHTIFYSDRISGERPEAFADVGLKPGKSADGTSLKANQEQFLEELWNNGYPSARITGRRAEARAGAGVAEAIYSFASGPRATFGAVTVNGAVKTRPAIIARQAPWEAGEFYERDQLIAYRDTLAGTGIFSSVDVETGALDENGAAPVVVTVQERKRRTIGAGVSFSTVEGPGGRLFLEYRNLFGGGERARAELEGNRLEQSISFDINKPLPRFPGAAFAAFEFSNETKDAFDARSIELSGGLAKRWLEDRLETRIGVALETSKVETDTSEERTYFISTPVSAVWDTEDDPIALRKGERASLRIIPYTGTDSFTQTEFTARSRVSFGGETPNGRRFTLAGRVRLGASFGSSFSNLPINKRFFSGGGSSVRGFDFQAVGPLDEDGTPIGGRSVIEGAAEARAFIYGPVQLAAFVDTGSVSTDSIPDIQGDYQTGIGGGVRYWSPIGPLRVDVAIPVERRANDPGWQLYISIGQPF